MFKNIIIITLILITTYLYFFNREDTVIEYITSEPIVIKEPVPVKVIETQYLPADIDTLAIIGDYFSRVEYKEQLDIKELGSVTLGLELSENRLQTLEWSYDLEIKRPKTFRNAVGLQIGFDDYILTYDRTLNSRLGVSASYLIKNNGIFLGIKYKF